MNLRNSFNISLPPDAAWTMLLDIERIVPCLPGATITETVDDRTYKGKVGIRLGPVALSFNGKATFVEIDDRGYRARVKALGMDEKGRGGAQADVKFQLESAGEDTRVVIDTDLNLSGSIAQYGRGAGIIQATSEQLVGEFADNLRRHLSRSIGTAPEAAGTDGTHAANGSNSAAARPISGFALLLRVLRRMVAGLFRRSA
jgi:hypothetical protein